MKQKRVPLIRQVGITDCGFACLTMLFNYYGYNIDISELKAKNSVGRNGLSLAKLKEICQENYFQFKAYKNFSSENDLLMNLPAILFSKTNHYVVVSRKRNNTFELLSEIYQFISITLISAIINAVTAIMCALVMMLQSFYLFQILFIIAAAQILIVYFLNKRARIKIKNYIADQSELRV